MVFNKKFQISDPTLTFTFNGEVIEECSEYRYLGVIFSTKGQRFKNNFTNLAEKSTPAVITTKTCVHSAVGNELPTPLHFKIFNQQVHLIMEYACEIWFQEKPVENLERILLKYLKDVLRVRQSSSDLAIFDETGQFPLFLRQQDLLIKYWLGILSMPNDNVIKATYNELISLSKQGHDNFAQKVRSLISRYGYADDHLDHLHKISEEELTSFEFTFREKRYSHYIKSWSNDLSKFPKLDTCRKNKIGLPNGTPYTCGLFLCCPSEETVEQTLDWPVIRDTMTVNWRRRNVLNSQYGGCRWPDAYLAPRHLKPS